MKKKSMALMLALIMLFTTGCTGFPTMPPETEIGKNTESGSEDSTGEIQTETENTTGTEDFVDRETESETDSEILMPEPEITEILISAAGDCTLGSNQKHTYSKSFHEYYDKYGADYFLQHVRSIFESDDLTIVNFEGTLTESENIRDKEWNHKGRPEYVNILTGSSVEAVTLGNNHIMDYNREGANDTFRIMKDAGIAYALNGDWGNQLGMYEVKGIKIGFVSVNEYYDGKRVYKWLENGLKELREQGADIVIAANHWGGDKTHVIEKDQVDLGHWCIDLGFDLVLGCHPHVLQGIEIYKDKFIVYSMGNFCYGGNKNPPEKESMIFQVKFTFADGILQPKIDGKVIPCQLSSTTKRNDYCPIVLEGEAAQTVIANMNKYSEEFGTVIDEEGNIVR